MRRGTIQVLPLGGFLIQRLIEKTMKITEYIKDTRTEMAHVTWPTRKQAISYSIVVVLVSIGTALLLGLADFVFSRLLTLFV